MSKSHPWRHTKRFITFKIEDKKMIKIDTEGEKEKTYDDFLAAMPENEPRSQRSASSQERQFVHCKRVESYTCTRLYFLTSRTIIIDPTIRYG